MLRAASFVTLVAGLMGLAAYWPGGPKFMERPYPVNTTLARDLLHDMRYVPLSGEQGGGMPVDSASGLHILMLNYSAYDSVYVGKVKQLVNRRLPGVAISDFWSGTTQELTDQLADQQIVVVTYPASGNVNQIRAYGKVLSQFVRQGGAVVFSGTDQFGVLQQYGLLNLSFGYFCSDLEVHEIAPEHPILTGAPSQFLMANYTYPLDIPDPNFVALADVRGYPTLGYKAMGNGKIVYLGLEYYYDEPISSQILENTLRWLTPGLKDAAHAGNTVADNWTVHPAKRSEEVLYAGTGATNPKGPVFDLKIYPNPYVTKASVDLDLLKQAPVTVEMTDEMGANVAVLLPYRQLAAGAYRFELPNVAAGVYFVKCQVGNQSTVRKVVKISAQ